MPGSRLRAAARRVVPLPVRRPLGIAVHRLWAGLRDAGTRFRDGALGRLPSLAARELVYDDGYYDRVDVETKAAHEALADALVRLLRPGSAVDVGCGTGIVLARLASHGVRVRGVEGSRAAIRRSPVGSSIVRANLERGVPELGRFDLCLCLEVAEHLTPRSGPGLVAGLVGLSDLVVFAAAPPGQPGTAHLNLRARSYWESLFAMHGFAESPLELDLRHALARVSAPEYVRANLGVYTRVSTGPSVGRPPYPAGS